LDVFRYSKRGRRFRRVLPIRIRTVVERSARELRRAHSRCAGRSHNRSAGAEELRAKTPRTAHLVVRARRLRHVHRVRGRVQRESSGLNKTLTTTVTRPFLLLLLFFRPCTWKSVRTTAVG